MIEKTEEYLKARTRAIKYIMYKFRTSSEVYNKLIELEFSENIAAKVINDLIQLEYINDEEYVRKFIESNKKTKKFVCWLKIMEKDGSIRPVYLYTVDADEFVVNKLLDRGSLSATTIVTNVQDFISIIGKGLASKDNSVSNQELVRVNEEIRTHPVEIVGKKQMQVHGKLLKNYILEKELL